MTPIAIVTALPGLRSGVPGLGPVAPGVADADRRSRAGRSASGVRREPPRRAVGSRLAIAGDAHRVGVPQHRDHEAALGVDREPDVHGSGGVDAVGLPRGVEERVIRRTSAPAPRRRRGAATRPALRRNASSAVQSTVRNVVTCGIAATSVSRLAISRRTGVMGSTPATSSAPPPAAFRSSTVIRPPGPVPVIVARSTPRSLASLRTAGVAARLRPARSRRRGRGATGRPPSATVERHQRRADRDRVPHRACSVAMRPGERRRDLDGGLRRLHLDERLVQRDVVAFGDEPRDDLALLETLAQVRHGEHALGHQYFTVRRTASAIRSTLGR